MPDKIIVIHSFPVWLPQTQTWLYNQIKYLSDVVEVHVVCERTENLDQFALPNIHCLKDLSNLRYFLEKALRKLSVRPSKNFLASVASETGAQIVHSHFGNIGWINLAAVRNERTKHVVTYYGYDISMLPAVDKRWLARYGQLFEEADLFICEGPHMAQELIRLGCPEEKVRVHHLGVETHMIPFRPRKWKPDQPFRVLLAGTFHEKKGIPFALQALARIQDTLPLEITIIGDATSEQRSQREKQTIIQIIEESGLKSKTRLLGFQPYSILFKEAYQHHLFISPSVTASNGDTEGGAPVALIEMIATGMPVISTLHCDIPEVVQYGIENWLVQEHDIMGLVNKLHWLTERPGDWDKILNLGRIHIEKEFNALQQGRKLTEIYHNLLGH